MKKKFVIIIICFIFLFIGYTNVQKDTKIPAHGQHGVWYEIFVRAFADSDGDGIGDLNGIINKLDYLNDNDPSTDTDLGINGIWLMPINPSPSYHGYDVTDYYDINPDYGTLEDFERLIEEAHKRDIKVIIDLVINHSSSRHPWFAQAINDKQSSYREYYNIVSKEAEGYNFNKQVWGHKVWNKVNNHYYYAIFWDQMPDLNYNSKALRDEMIKVATFWLEKGVDGFRIDAVSHIFGDGELPDNENHDSRIKDWWTEFNTALRKVKPDCYLVGEAWEPIEARAPYATYFDTTFNFDLGGKNILTMVKNERDLGVKNNGLIHQLDMIYAKNNEYSSHFIDAPFLTNHDMQRAMDYLNGDLEDMKLAASIYMTLPGNPFIYYGEEIGMKGKKPDEYIREPFIWGEDDSSQTSWKALNANESTPSVVNQDQEIDSLLNYYRTIIRLRQSSTALMKGDFRGIETSSLKVIAYERSYEDDVFLIIHNLDSKEVIIDTNELNEELTLSQVVFSNPHLPTLENSIMKLPSKSTTVLRLQ